MKQFSPKDYLKIDIANHYGMDKKDWDERIDWVNQQETHLEEFMKEADEPALYYAAVKAYRETQRGEAIGYMVSLDATSSGIQLLACLTGDLSAAKLCNVVSTGHREDAYTGIYREMVTRIGDKARIERDGTKQAIMTAFYSSTAMPKLIFGEGRLLDTFYKVLRDLAPGCWELNEAMMALWDPEALENAWVLPDNFHVKVKVIGDVRETVHFNNQPFDVFYKQNMPVEQGRSLGANMVHSIDGMIVRELTRRCSYDPKVVEAVRHALAIGNGTNEETHSDKMVATLWNHYLASGYLSARIFDYITPDNCGHIDKKVLYALLDSLPKKPFPVISIHDCFRVHPNYANDLRRQYNIQLMEIARSDLLSDILSQITGRDMQIQKLDPRMHEKILETDYALS